MNNFIGSLLIISTMIFTLSGYILLVQKPNDDNKNEILILSKHEMTCGTVHEPSTPNMIYRCENKEVICYYMNEQLQCQFKVIP